MKTKLLAATENAYARLFNDNPRQGDAALVLHDLRAGVGYDVAPSIEAWIKAKATAQGYEISVHEHNGAKALCNRVVRFASLTEAEMIENEEIIRVGPAEDYLS